MRSFAAVLLIGLSACSDGATHVARRLPDARLMTLAGTPGPSLASCPTDKCLTVLVAPWCGVCHGAVPEIVAFRRWLDARGVASRVIVGASDDLPAIKDFAKEFGADALLDPEQTVGSRSVPLFLVSDREGKVLKAVGGLPRAGGPEELARYLELI